MDAEGARRRPGPEKTQACRAVEADYREYEVGWFHHSYFRAQLRGASLPVPVIAETEERLRELLNAHRGVQAWAARDAARGAAT